MKIFLVLFFLLFLSKLIICNAQDEGACCINGICIDTFVEGCISGGGNFRGVGTLCSSGYCFGACCHYNSTCEITYYQGVCTGNSFFQGEFTTCTETICPLFGACCINSTICHDTITVQQCFSLGGIFDPGNICSNSRCQQCTGTCCLNLTKYTKQQSTKEEQIIMKKKMKKKEIQKKREILKEEAQKEEVQKEIK